MKIGPNVVVPLMSIHGAQAFRGFDYCPWTGWDAIPTNNNYQRDADGGIGPVECYKETDTKKNWEEANADCQYQGGYLFMPNDHEENSWMGSVYSDNTWIGLKSDKQWWCRYHVIEENNQSVPNNYGRYGSGYWNWAPYSTGVRIPSEQRGEWPCAGLDVCVVRDQFDTFYHSGYWFDKECRNEANRYICARKAARRGTDRSDDLKEVLCGEDYCAGDFVHCNANMQCECNEGFEFDVEGDFMCHPSKLCPEGMGVLIDSDGNYDPTNVDTCRLLPESATLGSCNAGPEGSIGQEVFISNRVLSTKPDGWEELDCLANEDKCIANGLSFDGVYYSKIFLADEMEKVFKDNALYYSKRIALDPEFNSELGIYVSSNVAITFRCRFSLADMDVSNEYGVAGQDQEVDRDNFDGEEVVREVYGTLGYKLEIDDSHYLGGPVTFTIKPVDAGQVAARAKSCDVSKVPEEGEEGEPKSVRMFGENGEYCGEKFVNFQVGEGWGSDGTQHFSFKAFKWSTDVADDTEEAQRLNCRIEFAQDEAGFTDDVTPADCP